jgi:5-methylthioadenosine/S-adenosylhomocysteine deaminase
MARKTCITGGTIVTMNGQREILPEATIAFEGDRITGIYPRGTWKPEGHEEVIRAKGMVILPGLINPHMHSRPFRALGDGTPSVNWHSRYAHPLSRSMDEKTAYLGGLIAFAENLRGGATCAANMPPFIAGADRAAWDIGIRAILFAHGGSDPSLVDSNESLETSAEHIARAGNQKGKRVQLWFGFGHAFECDKDYFRRMREYATKYQTSICGHVAISQRELDLNLERYGKPIVEYFADTGFLGPDVLLVHGVYFNSTEVQLMAKAGTSLAHCPSGVMRIGHPPTPILEMLEAGLNVCIATDGPLSTYRLDMFEVMRLSCFLQRLAKRSGAVMPAEKALELATIAGAKALGLDKEIGSLEVGKKADITLVNFRQAHLAPTVGGRHSNLMALLVFSCSAGDVDTVIVDGNVVVRHGRLQTIDENEIVDWANRNAEEVLTRVE